MKRKHKTPLVSPEYELVRIPLNDQLSTLGRSILKGFFLVLVLGFAIGWFFRWGVSIFIFLLFLLTALALVINTLSNYRCAPLYIQVSKEKMTITYTDKAYTIFFQQITGINRDYRATTRGVTWSDSYTIQANGESFRLIFTGMENELRLRNFFHQRVNQMSKQKLSSLLQKIRTAAQTEELQSYLLLKAPVKWKVGSPTVAIGFRSYSLDLIEKFTISMGTYEIRPTCIIVMSQGKKIKQPLSYDLKHRQNTIAKIMAVAVANGIPVDFHLNASLMIF